MSIYGRVEQVVKSKYNDEIHFIKFREDGSITAVKYSNRSGYEDDEWDIELSDLTADLDVLAEERRKNEAENNECGEKNSKKEG